MNAKRCPSCNVTISLSIDPPDGTCPECGQPYKIQKTLSDTRAGRRGGFRLIPVEPYRSLSIPDLLRYIHSQKSVYVTRISTHFEKPRSTVRNYIREMESNGLVSVEMQGKYLRVKLTEQGALLCPAN